jgi:hypothetical protein
MSDAGETSAGAGERIADAGRSMAAAGRPGLDGRGWTLAVPLFVYLP